MTASILNAVRLVLVLSAALDCGCRESEEYAPEIEKPPEVAGTPINLSMTLSIASDARGDIGPPAAGGGTEFRAALDALAAIDAAGAGAFLLTPGDMDPPASIRGAIDGGLGAGFPWFPAVGNHEAETASDMAYLRMYALPKSMAGVSNFSPGPSGADNVMYSFDAGSGSAFAHFAIIDLYYDGSSDVGAAGGWISQAAYSWLEADLAAAESRFASYIFVVGHEPIYPLPDEATGRVRHRGDSLDERPIADLLFISFLFRHGVSAYVCGHSHDFSAALLDGLLQIESGRAAGTADSGAPSTLLRLELFENMAVLTAFRSADGISYTPTKVLRLAPRGRR
jgi:hypothetical protein